MKGRKDGYWRPDQKNSRSAGKLALIGAEQAYEASIALQDAREKAGICPGERTSLDDYGEIHRGEMLAWRAWELTCNFETIEKEIRLSSVTAHYVWKPGVNVSEDSPFDSRLGFFSLKNIKDLRRYKEYAVIGVVKIWGEIVECSKGYRSEFAEIVHIHSFPKYIGPIAQMAYLPWYKRVRLSNELKDYYGLK